MFNFFKKKLTRKERSEKILKEEGIKINYNLPNIESDEEVNIRSKNEIAKRVTVLCAVSLVAFNNLSAEEILEYLEQNNLLDSTTPMEREFLNNPTEQQKLKETWKCEGIWVLLWSLGIVDELSFPDTMCNLNEVGEDYPLGNDYPLADPNIFLNKNFKLKNKSEILDMADLYYRYDWACVDARINGRQIDSINSGIIYERHYALNWLINYMDQKWDDISCDT